MQIPIKFPSDADVIAEEAARFRALSPRDRLNHIRGMLTTGWMMMQHSPKADFMRQHTLEQEELGKQRVKEFIARHAGRS